MSLNPFEVTKAVDFTDDQIRKNFVSYTHSDPYAIVDPRSVMPQFLVGGKGGGRTHLMRYFAYPLQKIRSSIPLEQIQKEGYLGIYFRCSGLNGSRFAGKHQSDEVWTAVFAYYMDLWLCEQLLLVLADLQKSEVSWDESIQASFTTNICGLLTSENPDIDKRINSVVSINQLLELLVTLRHTMDRAINNVALTKDLSVEILTSPGQMLFQTCKQASEKLPGLDEVMFTFLVDEYENLSKEQQRYFNTLLREKELPISFLIGGREWGVRTQRTLSADEENKKGSEYEWVVLENKYRTGTKYSDFCREMVTARLDTLPLSHANPISIDIVFSDGNPDRFHSASLLQVLRGSNPENRPHAVKLRTAVASVTADRKLVDSICAQFVIPEHPLLEKLAILRFYQGWSKTRQLELDAAVEARDFILRLLDDTADKQVKNFLNLWKHDMIAQVFWENDRRQPYLGFEKFVAMSGFLPRSLLMILKYVTHWAIFFGESPFESGKSISLEAQNAGVRDAARWFLSDAKPLGQEGEDCDRAIRRLGSLLRGIRLSDKPTEVAVTSFSTDFQGLDSTVAEIVQACVDHRLLIEVPFGRLARNQGSIHRKFQIHPMLSPLFGLSTSRRGDLSLRPAETRAIFDPRVEESEFSRIAQLRIAGLQAPFSDIDAQEVLFELG